MRGIAVSKSKLIHAFRPGAQADARQTAALFTTEEAVEAGRKIGLDPDIVRAEADALIAAKEPMAAHEPPMPTRLKIASNRARLMVNIPAQGASGRVAAQVGFGLLLLAVCLPGTTNVLRGSGLSLSLILEIPFCAVGLLPSATACGRCFEARTWISATNGACWYFRPFAAANNFERLNSG